MAVISKGERIDLPKPGDPIVRDDAAGDGAVIVPCLNDIISSCWLADPEARPDMPVIIGKLRAALDACTKPAAAAGRARNRSLSSSAAAPSSGTPAAQTGRGQ